MSYSEKLLFIGAGPFQVKGIKYAKALGYEVIATDGNSDAPGIQLAHHGYHIDVKDVAAHIEIANYHHIDGVLTVASDVAVCTVAAVGEALNLPGIPLSVAECCTDKECMRSKFRMHGVPSPLSFAVFSFRELLDRARTMNYPFVIKPADSAGSRGVRYIRHQAELEDAYQEAFSYSRKGKIVVEEYMDGIEVSVEAWVYKNQMHVLSLSDKVRTDPPYFLDVQVTFPSVYSSETQESIIAIADRARQAVGLSEGPLHMELILTRNGPVPVELAARGPGFKVFTDMIPFVTGIDTLNALFDSAFGKRPNLHHRSEKAAAIKFLSSSMDGVLESIYGLPEASAVTGIAEIEFYKESGEPVRPLTSGSDRIGHILALTDTRELAIKAIEKAQQRLSIIIKPK